MTNCVRRAVELHVSPEYEERVKQWVARNAYTFILIAIICAITWTVIVCQGVTE